MTGALGLDVGSTTVKIVVLAPDGEVRAARCERHHGEPARLARVLLGEARRERPHLPVGVTGSIGASLADSLQARPVHEVHAVALAVSLRHPGTRSVVELGGQDAKILFFDPEGRRVDPEMNDRCAAGTGATLDRVAGRLGLSAEALASIGDEGDLSVAAKCGVFAETDVVNLVKRGASPREAFAALCRAVVVQNLAVLTRGRLLRPPVLLLGGPHAHLPALCAAWRAALATSWSAADVAPGPVEVPPHAELFAAIGAARHAATRGRRLPSVSGVLSAGRVAPPLFDPRADRAALAALVPRAPERPLPAGPLRVFVGLDAGSTTSKLVAVDDAGRVRFDAYEASRANPVDDARRILEALAREAADRGTELSIAGVGVTGYGAELVGAAVGADRTLVETVAHARAAHEVMPDADVVVDVGGTDVKVMQVDSGVVRHFDLSTQCSAGHGAFLAQAARDCGVPLAQYAERALGARRMPRFTVGCGVFMDTDRVSFLRAGFDVDEILAGLAWALPRNIWEYVVADAPARLGRRFLLTGGTQLNLAAAWAQARYLREVVPGARVRVHPRPALCGAIGVALAARDTPPARTRFMGLLGVRELRARTVTGEATRCRRCDLGCARSVIELERAGSGAPQQLVVGNACERGAALESDGRRGPGHATDALAYEAARLFRRPPSSPRARSDAPRIGIPRVMGLYRSAPLLLGYLAAAGVPPDHVVLSPPTSERAFHQSAAGGVHDPCFPSKLVLSHVRWLAEQPLDVLLLPTLTHAKVAVRGTADTASCPIVAACGHTALAALRREGDPLARRGIEALVPELTLTDPARLDRQLFAAFGELLSIDRSTHGRALDAALHAQRRFHADCQRFGRRVRREARRRGRAVAVILARPYHADPGVQHGISTELAARGIPVLSIGSLPAAEDALLDLSEVAPAITNSGCAEKTWAARVIRADAHLVGVDLSSFRCGQDASIHATLAALLEDLGRPLLRLHDLDEDRPGTSFGVRIETFAHAVRRYERTLEAAA